MGTLCGRYGNLSLKSFIKCDDGSDSYCKLKVQAGSQSQKIFKNTGNARDGQEPPASKSRRPLASPVFSGGLVGVLSPAVTWFGPGRVETPEK